MHRLITFAFVALTLTACPGGGAAAKNAAIDACKTEVTKKLGEVSPNFGDTLAMHQGEGIYEVTGTVKWQGTRSYANAINEVTLSASFKCQAGGARTYVALEHKD